MPLSELEAYHRQCRAAHFSADAPFQGIGWRNKIHWIFSAALPLSRVLSRRKLTVLNRTQPADGRPAIFACTHVGRYDIETGLELAGRPCWFLMGDPGSVYRSFDGLFLFLNGVIFLDTAYREDRHIGKENSIRALKQGANLLIFPEGYELAEKKRLTEKLRDELCSLKWEIWNQFPVIQRGTLPSDASEKFLDSIMSQSENGYTVEEIKRTRYHDKRVVEPEEAFACLGSLMPRRENAFLFRT